jgi:hypothetical protein
MDENDICLQGIPVTMDTRSVQDLAQLDSSPLFPAKISCTKEDEISSGFFLFNIINSVYQTYFVARYRAIIFPCMLAIPATPLLVKSYYDVNLFGITPAEHLVTMASILGFMLGF